MKFALFNNFLGPGVRALIAPLLWALAEHLEKIDQKWQESSIERIRFASNEPRVSILLVDELHVSNLGPKPAIVKKAFVRDKGPAQEGGKKNIRNPRYTRI